MEDIIHGRVGGEHGFPVRCTIEEDRIVGRAGGRLNGKKLILNITDSGVDGEIGGETVSIHLDGGLLKGHVGEHPLSLRGVDNVTGRLGESITGWEIFAQQRGDELVGRLGSAVQGRDFTLSLGGAPGWIGTLVAVLAFWSLEPRLH